MGCTGGCINGGGQPIITAPNQGKFDIRERRAKVLYAIDQGSTFRKSHENEAVKKVYTEFLGAPNSHLSHELLHTHYKKRDAYSK